MNSIWITKMTYFGSKAAILQKAGEFAPLKEHRWGDLLHQLWGRPALKGPGEPSCSGKLWVRWSELRTWWPYSAGPCLWQPGPVQTNRDKQTIMQRERNHQTPFKSVPYFSSKQSPNMGSEGLRPACIMGEPLPGGEPRRSWYYSQGPLGQELSLLLWQEQAGDDMQLLLEVKLEVKSGYRVIR